METKIKPIKCALRYKPPVLILVYKDEVTGKVRRRSMPLRRFNSDTDTSFYMKELKASGNRLYISTISDTQLLSLLNKVKYAQEQKIPPHKLVLSSLQDLPPLSTRYQDTGDDKGAALHAKSRTLDEKFNDDLKQLLSEENLPKEETQNPYKDMDSIVNVKSTPGDSRNEKSNEDNSRNISSEIPDYSANFDSESEKLFQDEKLQNFGEGDASSLVEELDEDEVLNKKYGGDSHEDLNKLGEDQLEERKAEMDVLFEANRIQPGDGGYEYDKEMDFGGPKIECEWDSDGSSVMEI